MNMDRIKKYVRHVSTILLLLSAGLAALTAKQVYAYMNTSRRIEDAVTKAEADNGHDEETVKKHLGAGREVADALKKKNMFVPPAPKPNPPVCYGIIGSAAIINGKQYKAGDKVGNAEIVSVGTKEVTIMWEGNEMRLVPFAQNYRPTASKGGSRPPSGGDKGKEQPKPQQATAAVVAGGPGPGGPRPGGHGRGGFMGMSPEDRQRMIERYRNMSPEEQQRFREEQRRRFMEGGGSGRGGDRGPGGFGRGGRGR